MNSFVRIPVAERHNRLGLRRSAIALCLLLAAFNPQVIGAQDSVRTGSTLRNLNLRSAPNLDSQVLLTLPDGASFTLIESSGEWIRVRAASGQEGWLYSPFVRFDPPRAAAAGAAVTSTPGTASADSWTGTTLESLNLRSGPSTTASRIELLPPRMRLTILEQRGAWLRVRANQIEGWVSGDYVRVTSTPAQTGVTEPPETPVRIPTTRPDADQRIRELTTENSRLATELAESTARLVQADRERAALREERDSLRDALDALESELTATRSALLEAAQATGESSDAQSELNSLGERLNQSQERVADLEQEIAELQQSRSALEARLESNASDAQQLEAALETERSQRAQMERDLAAALADRDQANTRLTLLTGRVQELESEKEAAENAGADLRAELERTRAETAQAETRIATLEDEVDSLRSGDASRADASEDLEQARRDLNRLIAERARQEETLMEASTRESQLRTQLQSAAAELDAARLDVNRALVALEDLQAENEGLRRELESTVARPSAASAANVDAGEATLGPDPLPLEPLVPAASETPESEPLEPIVQPAAPEPEPEPQPEPAQPDPVTAASQRVETWRAAWSSADIDTYLDSYVPGYRPDANTSHQAWRAQRRQRLTAPSFIEVRFGTLQVVSSSNERVVLRFEQDYESNTFSDRVMKTLTLVPTEDGDWRIQTETASPL